jgi:hypothetical protein
MNGVVGIGWWGLWVAVLDDAFFFEVLLCDTLSLLHSIVGAIYAGYFRHVGCLLMSQMLYITKYFQPHIFSPSASQ